MSKQPLKYLKNEVIEDLTTRRIREYEAKAGGTVKLPVPIEKIVEQVLGLDFEWDEIEEQPGEMILGGLCRKTRTIVLNEKHLELFELKPGLLRSTQVHEAGHADLEGGLGEQGPSLFGEDQERIVHRHSTKSNRQLEVLFDLALHNEKAYRLWRKLTEGQDTPEQKSAVDRYQSAFMMPKWLLEEAAQRYDLTQWRDLYALAKEAEVNISNLTTRLLRLEMIFIPKGSKTVYRSKDDFTGQKTLSICSTSGWSAGSSQWEQGSLFFNCRTTKVTLETPGEEYGG